jgi:hypothetical protein
VRQRPYLFYSFLLLLWATPVALWAWDQHPVYVHDAYCLSGSMGGQGDAWMSPGHVVLRDKQGDVVDIYGPTMCFKVR